jgi:hypothetical protein
VWEIILERLRLSKELSGRRGSRAGAEGSRGGFSGARVGEDDALELGVVTQEHKVCVRLRADSEDGLKLDGAL